MLYAQRTLIPAYSFKNNLRSKCSEQWWNQNFHRDLLWVCHHNPIVSAFQESLLQLHMYSVSVRWDFFTAELQLCMVDGEVLCSDAVTILLDVNNTKRRQQLSFFLSTSAWKITKPHTSTNSTKQKLFKRKAKCENSKQKKMKHVKLKFWRSKEKCKHLKEKKWHWSYLKLLAICFCTQISLLPSPGRGGLLEICIVRTRAVIDFPHICVL